MANAAESSTTRRTEEYRRRRDFEMTPEPDGREEPEPADLRRFVVQRHRARRLHYDFRLEVDGVLVSWAVPKGPTLDSAQRRLAVHVEDHPIEYLDFEGVIPEGSYGAGDVIVWDRGTWAPAKTDDPAAAIAAGELHLDLTGEKLAGHFALIRRDDDRDWILVHKEDAFAVPRWDPEDHPRSVTSGRTNAEVAAAPMAEWRSGATPERSEVPLGQPPGVLRSWTGPTPAELGALDDLGGAGTWQIGDREVSLTNLDKALFPPSAAGDAVTKRDLIRYWVLVGPTLLPYLAGRPLNARRAPNGVDGDAFWQKEVPPRAPSWVTTWRNDEADPGETERYVVVDSIPTLAWLANLGVVELHPWTSTCDDPHRPSWAMIDIDPGSASSFDDVLALTRLFRTALEHLGVEGRPKVTGRRGMQIWIPIGRGPTFGDTRSWVEVVSRAVGRTVPELVSWEWRVEDRRGLARLDYTQNAINRTLVAPYSVRLRDGAPVSVPLEWSELESPDLQPDRWTIRTVLDRLDDVGDPFAPLLTLAQSLPQL